MRYANEVLEQRSKCRDVDIECIYERKRERQRNRKNSEIKIEKMKILQSETKRETFKYEKIIKRCSQIAFCRAASLRE